MMRKIILMAIFLCMNTKGWAIGTNLLTEMTIDGCKNICSPQKCKTVTGQQTCITRCGKQIDIQPCLNILASPKSLSDANTVGGIKKEKYTRALLSQAPNATYYLNAGDFKLREAEKTPTTKDYQAVNYVLVNLRGMCAQTINEYLTVSKGKDDETKRQFLDVIRRLDQIIMRIKEPYIPVPDQPVRTNIILKKTVGDAELLIKNCIQQGSAATYSFKNQASQKVKGFFSRIAAPFTCKVCTPDNCTKLDVYKKCIETCPEIYRKKCQSAANQTIRDSYQEEYNNRKF